MRLVIMAILLVILVALSLNAIVDANKLTFTKAHEKIYVETDAQHYAMWGQVKDKDGVLIVAVNGENHYQQSMRCVTDQQKLSEVKKEYVEAYGETRKNFLKDAKTRHHRSSGIISWSVDISSDAKETTSIVDFNIYSYSSKHFPSKLARVIIDKGVVIFVHRDGYIAMKTMDCLLKNEKILVKGIRKINTGDHILPRLKPVGDEPLEKYLTKHPIDESEFYLEQEYTKGEEAKMSSKQSWLLSKIDYENLKLMMEED